MNPFIVYALPRSRTKWLSEFLSYGDVKCLHEISLYAHSLICIRDILKFDKVGICDTALVRYWQQLTEINPGANVLVIRRPINEIRESLLRFGIHADQQLIELNTCLDMVASLPGVLSVNYCDLDKEETCTLIFEHCLQRDFDFHHWDSLRDRNIQVNMHQMSEEYAENYRGIKNLQTEMEELCQ